MTATRASSNVKTEGLLAVGEGGWRGEGRGGRGREELSATKDEDEDVLGAEKGEATSWARPELDKRLHPVPFAAFEFFNRPAVARVRGLDSF